MSAMVCGKRSFFEDLESAAGSPTLSSTPPHKKFRCSSPGRFTYSPPFQPTFVNQLKSLFPDFEIQVLEKALEEAGNDLNSAINSLNELRIAGEKQKAALSAEEKIIIGKGDVPLDAAVDLIVKEMASATSVDDAKSRAAHILDSLVKSISVQAGAKVAEGFRKEHMMLREQIEALLKDNAILKRAVSIQHERQREHDESHGEVQQLQQLLTQYQEQIRTLEVNNYALAMHLRQAEQRTSIPGHFHPDIF